MKVRARYTSKRGPGAATAMNSIAKKMHKEHKKEFILGPGTTMEDDWIEATKELLKEFENKVERIGITFSRTTL